MTQLHRHLIENNRVWYSSIDLINKFGRDELNKLYIDGLIDVRNGLNTKVIKLK
jgi:hypothetical protein